MFLFQIEMQCERLHRLLAFLQALAEHKAKDIGKLSVSVVPSRKFLMGTLDCWPPKVKSIPLVHSWTEKWLQLWTLPLAVIFNMVGKNSSHCPIKDLQKKISNGLLMKWYWVVSRLFTLGSSGQRQMGCQYCRTALVMGQDPSQARANSVVRVFWRAQYRQFEKDPGSIIQARARLFEKGLESWNYEAGLD